MTKTHKIILLFLYLLAAQLAFGVSNLIIFGEFWKDGNAYPSLFIVINISSILSFFITKQNVINSTYQISQLLYKLFEYIFLLIFFVLTYWFYIAAPTYYKEGIFLFFLFTLLFTFIIQKLYVNFLRTKNYTEHQSNCIIIGKSEYATEFTLSLEKNAWMGYHIISYPFVKFDDYKGFENFVISHQIKTIFIDWDEFSTRMISEQNLRNLSENHLIRIYAFSNIFSNKLLPNSYNLNDNIPYISLFSYPLDSFLPKILKRSFDIIFAIIVSILILSWLIPLISIMIMIEDGSPVFFRQERIGYNDMPFKIIKFRSMRKDAEKFGPQLSKDSDPRITKIGRVLRKYRIDEFPQFINVLMGDMSIVGPRPERRHFIDKIIKHSPKYKKLHSVKPGITSLGQVYYGYAENVHEMRHRLFYDLLYIREYDFLLDLKIIFLTIWVVIKGKGK